MIAKVISLIVIAGVVVAVSIVRYAEPQLADRLVHRYGLAPPLVVCGVAFAIILFLAHELDKS
jgi:hypothetical protein